MESTWSAGLDKRLREKRRIKAENLAASSDQLPAISPTASNKRGALYASASEPTLATEAAKEKTQKMTPQKMRKNAFIERQLQHSSVQARRDISHLQKQLVRDGRAADDVEFWGAQGVFGFKTYLEKKFGSVVAGWRALDRDKSGRLSFYEFCNACRIMGYHGNLKKLWAELDANESGAVSLMEIDPEVGHYVGTFKLALMKEYGDMLTAWKTGLDTNGTGRIEEQEIADCCKKLGLGLDPRKLYLMLLSGPKGLGLSLIDFDPDAWNRSVTGDFKGVCGGKANMEFLEDLPDFDKADLPDMAPKKGGAREFRAQLKAADKAAAQAELDKVTKMKAGLHTKDGFKTALINRCGSLLGAWREKLDLDGNGRLTFGEFTQALHRLSFHGNITKLWKELLPEGKSYLDFSDLDPETAAELSELTEKLEKKHGNMLLAWLKELDTTGSGVVNLAQFTKACKSIGYDREPKALFRKMQPDAGRKFLTLWDFDTKAYLALSRGDFRMISEKDEPPKKRPMEMSFDERQEAGFFFQIRRAWNAAKREEFAKACKSASEPDRLIDTMEEFEDLCCRRFGSLMGAWRCILDLDGNGKLTFNEFCLALRRLGYAGDFKALWRRYDADSSGFISMRELDPTTDTIVKEFLALLAKRFGTLDSAWKNGFMKDPHDSIDITELAAACAALQFSGDPKKLFKALQPMPGRVLLTIWDLDPECTRKRQRGQEDIMSMPKNPVASPIHGKKKGAFNPYKSMEEKAERAKQSAAEMDLEEPSVATLGTSTAGGAHASGASMSRTSPSGSTFTMKGTSDLEVLQRALTVRYGSTVAAWRAALDENMVGYCSWGIFVRVIDECAYKGNVKKLWEELTLGNANVTLKDLDCEACKLLDRFRTQLLGKAGSLVKAWEGLDADNMGRVDEEEFVKGCTNMGLAIKHPKRVFRLLLARHGQRSLSINDLHPLLIGVDPPDRAETWLGKPEPEELQPPPPAEGEGSEPPSPAGPSPNSTMNKSMNKSTNSLYPGSPKHGAGELRSPREHVQHVTKEHYSKDFRIATLDGFKNMLINKFGSLFSAWRHCLDVDQNGIVTQSDFAAACRFLGVKAITQLWGDFDVNRDGQISLKEIDPECGDMFAQLEKILLEQFGSTKEGWKEIFLSDGSAWCEKPKFVAQCKAIGWKGDADRFFQLLKPEPGRRYLTYDDLWINLDPNYFRAASPSSPKGGSPPSSPAKH